MSVLHFGNELGVANMLIVILFDLVAPLVALLVFAHLIGTKGWSIWSAYFVPAFAYFAWAVAVSQEVGYAPSTYVLAAIGLPIRSLIDVEIPLILDKVLTWYIFPFATIVLAPTMVMWLFVRVTRLPGTQRAS